MDRESSWSAKSEALTGELPGGSEWSQRARRDMDEARSV